MTLDDKAERLCRTFGEQIENLRMLRRAAMELEQNAERLASWSATPTDTERDVQDRFIFRFSKMVDAMRKRLFPQLLDYTDELSDLPTLRDRLNRLEKYGLLDRDIWLELGMRRNAFEHDYPDAEDRDASLQQAFEAVQEIHTTLCRCRDWLVTRYALPLPLPQ